MTRIGIFSENYDHDSCALRNILEQTYDKTKYVFLPIIKTMEGDNLENVKKVRGLLEKDIQKRRLDFVIILRDLDSDPSDTEKIKKRTEWFKKVAIKQELDIFFLTIYQLEALILADIQKFNELYDVKITLSNKPLFQQKPKEFLMQKTFKAKRKYQESHAPEIFEELHFDELYNNHCHPDHPCFQSFIDELTEKIS
ncbi:MAG: hypothetical protein ACK4TA_15620 [Saprospiraceae bacterium]